ncbi:hypothetical protein [Corynebacterium casei]|uniref:hypothetical protein n=1 Tax=Corynebacterium casei TaxID=160386 RepID=UPI003FD41618
MEYQNRIAVHPNYQGMPDLWNSDGSIQWEAPSNRAPSSRHAETHVKGLNGGVKGPCKRGSQSLKSIGSRKLPRRFILLVRSLVKFVGI